MSGNFRRQLPLVAGPVFSEVHVEGGGACASLLRDPFLQALEAFQPRAIQLSLETVNLGAKRDMGFREFGEGLSILPCEPSARFEFELDRLVPRRATRLVLCDAEASDIGQRAARQAAGLGYEHVVNAEMVKNATMWAEEAVQKLSAKPVSPEKRLQTARPTAIIRGRDTRSARRPKGIARTV